MSYKGLLCKRGKIGLLYLRNSHLLGGNLSQDSCQYHSEDLIYAKFDISWVGQFIVLQCKLLLIQVNVIVKWEFSGKFYWQNLK